jgi:hypothetical protein
MGNERIGRLPRTVAWRKIVDSLKIAGSRTEADVSEVAAIRQLMAPKETANKRIGLQLREKRAAYFARG